MTTIVVARMLLAWSAIVAAAGAVVANPTAVPADTGAAAAELKEASPDDDDRLSRPELRWCLFESVRLDGQRDAVNRRTAREVAHYESRSGVYAERCVDKEFLEEDGAAVERELTPETRQALRERGAARVTEARVEREARRVHVVAAEAAVRSAPAQTAATLGRVPRWGDLVGTGRVQGTWREVEWPTSAPDATPASGWVPGELLEGGAGAEARFAYCEERAGPRAAHNEVVRTDIDLNALSVLIVENGLNDDAYVKLVRDRAVVSLYVAAGRTASLTGVKAGSYEIAYATGSGFSRGCDSFSRRGSARRSVERIDYGRRAVVWTLSLHDVGEGDARAHSMSYDDFDRL